jgi:hypothetical protein
MCPTLVPFTARVRHAAEKKVARPSAANRCLADWREVVRSRNDLGVQILPQLCACITDDEPGPHSDEREALSISLSRRGPRLIIPCQMQGKTHKLSVQVVSLWLYYA